MTVILRLLSCYDYVKIVVVIIAIIYRRKDASDLFEMLL